MNSIQRVKEIKKLHCKATSYPYRTAKIEIKAGIKF